MLPEQNWLCTAVCQVARRPCPAAAWLPGDLLLPCQVLHPKTPHGTRFSLLGMLLTPAQPSLALAAAGREQEELSGSGRPTFKALILFA